MLELLFLKSAYININITKKSALRRNLLAKTYEQQTRKHQTVEVLDISIWLHI